MVRFLWIKTWVGGRKRFPCYFIIEPTNSYDVAEINQQHVKIREYLQDSKSMALYRKPQRPAVILLDFKGGNALQCAGMQTSGYLCLLSTLDCQPCPLVTFVMTSVRFVTMDTGVLESTDFWRRLLFPLTEN